MVVRFLNSIFIGVVFRQASLLAVSVALSSCTMETDFEQLNLDKSTATISIANLTLVEGATGNLQVILSKPLNADVVIPYVSSSDSATDSADYSTLTGTLTITAGQTIGLIPVTTLDDGWYESAEEFTISLTSPSNATLSVENRTIIISDNETAPTVVFDSPSSSVDEDVVGGSTDIALSLSGPSQYEIIATVMLTGGSATSGSDYTLASSTITFAANTTTAVLPVGVVDDLVGEGNETADIEISAVSAYGAVGAQNTHTLTINEDDVTPFIYFANASENISEAVGAHDVIVELSEITSFDVAVNYATANGAALAGSDYTSTSGTLTIVSGQTVGTISLPVADDSVSEATEDLTVTLTGGAVNGIISAPSITTLNILDNDGLPDVNFASNSGSTDEDDGTGSIVVQLSNPSSTDIIVNYTVADGTATSAAPDYTLASGTLTFAAGSTVGTISPAINDDTIAEGAETFTVTLASTSVNAELGSTTSHIHTINDDESPPTVYFAAGSSNANENVGTHDIVVNLSNVASANVVFSVVASGTATDPADYTLSATTLTFTPGQTARTISVSVVDDAIGEPGETVVLDIDTVTGANATEGSPGTHTFTINSNDTPTVQFELASSAPSETDVNFTHQVEVTLANAASTAITVDYILEGTTTASGGGIDYTLLAGTLTFAASDTSEMIDIAIVGDNLPEVDEIIDLRIQNVVGNATMGLQPTHRVTIDDDDILPFTWIGVTGNGLWSDPLNWSTGNVPDSSASFENAIFNNACTGANCNVTADVAVDVMQLLMESTYTGTITLQNGNSFYAYNIDMDGGALAGANQDIRVDDDFELTGGTLTLTSANLRLEPATALGVHRFYHTGGTVNWGSQGLTIGAGTGYTIQTTGLAFNNVSIEDAAVTLVGNMDVNGDLTINNVTAGRTINSHSIFLSGNLIAVAGQGGTTTIRLDGSGPQTLTGAAGAQLPHLAIASSGTVNLVGEIEISRSFTYTSGTVDAGTSLLSLVGANAATITSNSAATFYDVEFAKSAGGNLTIAGDLVASNKISVNNAASVTIASPSGQMSALGDIEILGGGGGAGTIRTFGTGPHTLTGNGIGVAPGVSFESTGVTSLVGNIKVAGGWANTAGNPIVPGTSTVELTANQDATFAPGAQSFYNLIFSKTVGADLSMTSNATVLNDLTINNTAASTYIDGGTVFLHGDLINQGTVAYTASGATDVAVHFVGTADQQIIQSGTSDRYLAGSYVVNKATGKLVLGANVDFQLAAQNLDLQDGDIIMDGFNLNIGGALSTAAGTKIFTGCGNLTFGSHSPALGSIINGDDVTIDVAGDTQTEGANLNFIVSVTPQNCAASTFDYVTSDGTAEAAGTPSDYTAIALTSATIPANTSSITLPITTNDDAAYELSEYMTMTLSNLMSGVTAGTIAANSTLTDNDTQPTLNVADDSVTEGDNAIVVVSLTSSSGAPVVFSWTTVDGTAVAPGDYTTSSGTVTIAAGSTSHTLVIPTILDGTEAAEYFTVQLSGISNALAGDLVGQIDLVEGSQPLSPFNILGVTGGTDVTQDDLLMDGNVATIHWQNTANETGYSVTIYEQNGTTVKCATQVVAADATSQNFSACALTEGEEYRAEVSATNGFDVLNAANSSFAFLYVPSITVTGATVSENVGGGIASAVATLSSVSDRDVTFTYSTVDGTAVSTGLYQDFTAVTTVSVTITAGSASANLNVALVDDSRDEDDQSFTVGLASVVGAKYAGGTGTITISDDDAAPTVSIAGVSAVEGETAILTATISGISEKTISFNYATADGTATTAAGDYTGVASGALAIAIGSTTTTMSVVTLNDVVNCEALETIDVNLSSLTNATAGTTTASISVTDNDFPVVTMGDQTVTEGTALDFSGTLSFACSTPLVLNYFTSDLTAVSSMDYTFVSGSVTVPIGNTVVPTISVATTDDTQREATESLLLAINTTAPGMALTGTSQAVGTITDNEVGEATIKILAGNRRTCALSATGKIKCWGALNNLGYAGPSIGDEPGEMGDNLGYVEMGTHDAGGAIHHTVKKAMIGDSVSCAILDDDRFKCWGSKAYVGLGSSDSSVVDWGDQEAEMGDALPYVDLGTIDGLGVPHTVKDFAISDNTTCVVLNDNRMKCFGAVGSTGAKVLVPGATGNIGDADGEMGDALGYANLGSGRTVKSISATPNNFCAILDNDRVKCWGSGANGANGNGSTGNIGGTVATSGDNLPYVDLGTVGAAGVTPLTVAELSGSSGSSPHYCARFTDGKIKCWGRNAYGGLGLGDSADRGDQAGEMGDLLPYVDLGTENGLGISPHTVKKISVGAAFSCAQLNTDQLKCWGWNLGGRLGRGNTTDMGDDANEMGDHLSYIDIGTVGGAGITPLTVLDFAVSGPVVFVKRSDNTTVSWGAVDPGSDQNYGILGQGHPYKIGDEAGEMGDNLVPIDLGTGLTPAHFVQSVRSGATIFNVGAILNNGKLKVWGGHDITIGRGLGRFKAAIGDDTGEMASVQNITLPTGRTAIDLMIGSDTAAGFSFNPCALLDNGEAYCWGNGINLAGNGLMSTDGSLRMGDNIGTEAFAGLQILKMQVNVTGACALLSDRSFRCWGAGQNGFFGEGLSGYYKYDTSSAPVLDFGTGKFAVNFALTSNAGCAVLNDQTLKCWGASTDGRTGSEQTSNNFGDASGEMGDALPTVNLGTGFLAAQVSPFYAGFCVKSTVGELKCFGANNGTTTGSFVGHAPGTMGDNLLPADLGTLRSVKTLGQSSQSYHSCVIRDDNKIVCWGNIFTGNDTAAIARAILGMGQTTSGQKWGQSDIMPVDLDTDVPVQVSTGRTHTCALMTNGSAKCWGTNHFGWLGYDDITVRGGTPGTMGTNLLPINLVW